MIDIELVREKLERYDTNSTYVSLPNSASTTSAMNEVGERYYTFKSDGIINLEKFKREYDSFQKSLDMMDRIAKEHGAQIERIIEKEKKEMENRCGTCKHENLGLFDNPCNSCCRYSKWEQKDILSNEQIKNVIFNPPATVVFWKDGTKTVVKCENEEFDAEKGLAMAFSKKFLGNKYEYYNTFKHWLKKAPGYKKEK